MVGARLLCGKTAPRAEPTPGHPHPFFYASSGFDRRPVIGLDWPRWWVGSSAAGPDNGSASCGVLGLAKELDPTCGPRTFQNRVSFRLRPGRNRHQHNAGSSLHVVHAFGTAAKRGGLFGDAVVNAISEICRGVSPSGTRCQHRAPPENSGGNGRRLAQARRG
jgi:hypothetical protein